MDGVNIDVNGSSRSNGLLLAALPIEILANITSRLYAHDLFIKLFQCGDRNLIRKLKAGGILSAEFTADEGMKVGFNILKSFPHLTEFTMHDSTIEQGDIHDIIELLPKGLRYLSIHHRMALELVKTIQSYSTSFNGLLSEDLVDLKDLFPSLEFLQLVDDMLEVLLDEDDYKDFLESLPTSLTFLEITPNPSSPFFASYLRYLPPHLKTLASPTMCVDRHDSIPIFDAASTLAYLDITEKPQSYFEGDDIAEITPEDRKSVV